MFCETHNIVRATREARKVQMTESEVRKTKRVANNRIIIEQVIRRLKTFRIIQNELPVSLIPHVAD